jgi:hypothetical protein
MSGVEAMSEGLPRPQAWVLKVVQAAVLGGAQSIAVRLLRHRLLIDLVGMFESTEDALRAIQQARRGSLGELLVSEGSQGMQLQVEVSSAAQRAELCHELRHYAFPCPVPLTLDRRRLDGLHACPSHGQGAASHPFFLAVTQRRGARFTLPSGSFPRGELDNPEGAVSAACLLSYFLAHVGYNLTRSWQTQASKSVLYWIAHGVVVARLELPGRARAVSAALFLSAEGLTQEGCGLRLRQDPQSELRLREARNNLRRSVRSARLDLQNFVQQYTTLWRVLSLGLAGLGVVSLVTSPFPGILAVCGGIWASRGAGETEREVVAELQAELARFQKSW